MNLDPSIITAVADAIRNEKDKVKLNCLTFDISWTSEEEERIDREATHYDPEERSVRITYTVSEVTATKETFGKEDVYFGSFDQREIEILEEELNTGEWQ